MNLRWKQIIHVHEYFEHKHDPILQVMDINGNWKDVKIYTERHDLRYKEKPYNEAVFPEAAQCSLSGMPEYPNTTNHLD